jgi:hypothetical protein
MAEAVVSIASAVADSKRLVNPAGMTEIGDLVGTPPNAYVPGRLEDVQEFVSAGGAQQLAVLEGVIARAERRLGRFFLSELEVRRDAERVTAEEFNSTQAALRRSATGLESNIKVEVIDRIVEYEIKKLVKNNRISRKVLMSDDRIRVQAVGGLESLGQQEILSQVRQAFGIINQTGIANIPGALDIIRPEAAVVAVFANAGLEPGIFTKTDEELAALREERERQMVLQQQGPELQRLAAQAGITGGDQ